MDAWLGGKLTWPGSFGPEEDYAAVLQVAEESEMTTTLLHIGVIPQSPPPARMR